MQLGTRQPWNFPCPLSIPGISSSFIGSVVCCSPIKLASESYLLSPRVSVCPCSWPCDTSATAFPDPEDATGNVCLPIGGWAGADAGSCGRQSGYRGLAYQCPRGHESQFVSLRLPEPASPRGYNMLTVPVCLSRYSSPLTLHS